MIQRLIDEYVKAGGRAPYAILLAPGVYDDVPVNVFCAWTPVIHQRIVVLPLAAASALLHESIFLEPRGAEGKSNEDA